MNDFLNRLAAHKANSAAQEAARPWYEKFGEGTRLLGTDRDPAVAESVRAFLQLVPANLFKKGQVVPIYGKRSRASKPIPLPNGQSIYLTDFVFSDKDKSKGMWSDDPWVVEGERVLFVTTRSEEFEETVRYYDILQDGRISASGDLRSKHEVEKLIKSMIEFAIRHRL
ncbi:hypothetical protein ACX80Z_15810 [Arthrobacter sp. TMT4-20]